VADTKELFWSLGRPIQKDESKEQQSEKCQSIRLELPGVASTGDKLSKSHLVNLGWFELLQAQDGLPSWLQVSLNT